MGLMPGIRQTDFGVKDGLVTFKSLALFDDLARVTGDIDGKRITV